MPKTFHEFDLEDDREAIIQIENSPEHRIYDRKAYTYTLTEKEINKKTGQPTGRLIDVAYLKLLLFWEGPEYAVQEKTG